MDADWKRPKEIPSNTEMIKTNCGGLYLTLGFEDDKLIEVRATIGKNGTCSNIMLDIICKLMSITLQSEMPRYKIVKKFRKQFSHEKDKDMTCDQDKFFHEEKEYQSCMDYIVKKVIKELDK